MYWRGPWLGIKHPLSRIWRDRSHREPWHSLSWPGTTWSSPHRALRNIVTDQFLQQARRVIDIKTACHNSNARGKEREGSWGESAESGQLPMTSNSPALRLAENELAHPMRNVPYTYRTSRPSLVSLGPRETNPGSRNTIHDRPALPAALFRNNPDPGVGEGQCRRGTDRQFVRPAKVSAQEQDDRPGTNVPAGIDTRSLRAQEPTDGTHTANPLMRGVW